MQEGNNTNPECSLWKDFKKYTSGRVESGTREKATLGENRNIMSSQPRSHGPHSSLENLKTLVSSVEGGSEIPRARVGVPVVDSGAVDQQSIQHNYDFYCLHNYLYVVIVV